MPIDLTQRLGSQEDMSGLEDFVAACLCAAGVWKSPRVSDGLASSRSLLNKPDCVQLCGRIYEIDDQKLHPFFLSVTREAERVRWELRYDFIHIKRLHIELCEHYGKDVWVHIAEGVAELDGEKLVPTLAMPSL